MVKNPRTKQEQTAIIDEKIVKGRRWNLPDSWSDINRCVQRSWKKHRKKQYRAN